MPTALQLINSVLLVAALGMLMKLYAEHVDLKIKVTVLWDWWVKVHGDGKTP